MDIPLLNVSVREARAQVHAYRKVLKNKRTVADNACLRAYRELLKGERVLDLHEVFSNTGLNYDKTPQLAIARADMKWCHCTRYWSYTRFWSAPTTSTYSSGRVAESKVIQVPRAKLECLLIENGQSNGALPNCSAMVPLTPPDVRAKLTKKLLHFYMLWEAEWEPEAPGDPMLLEPLGSSLYKVIATWDLTDLERAVLFDMRMN